MLSKTNDITLNKIQDMNKLMITLGATIFLFSCNYTKVKTLETQIAGKDEQIELLNAQLEHIQSTNSGLLDRMAELSVISQSDSRSIQHSLENINRQNAYIQDLTDMIHEKDSINFALVSNLKKSLIDINDQDIQVEVKGSAVYVSISDNLLFSTASSKVSKEAYEVLGKVARIINDHDQVNVLVEGHTDNVPIANEKYSDNWDLSVLRSTSVVRVLQEEYNVDPQRITAAGRASYLPKMANSTSAGKRKNRRTEIIITPKLDQFFKLLESEDLVG
jgi:chemotaxis protein MotB